MLKKDVHGQWLYFVVSVEARHGGIWRRPGIVYILREGLYIADMDKINT
jgi:hypothetical protein